MKLKLILTLLLLSNIVFAQKVQFNIKYSEPLAVFVFMQQLSENYPDNVFRKTFQQSKYNTAQYKNIIAQFEQLPIDYTYTFAAYPYASKIPMQTRDMLKKNLVAAHNINEFKRLSMGLMPNNILIALSQSLEAFIPIYNELIYAPNKVQFEKQLQEIDTYAREQNINGYFETGLKFYNANWDNSIPFEIAFYPLPDAKWFSGQAFYNNFICAIQTNLTDYKDLFSVMLHEIYHIVYDEQSLEVKKTIHETFSANKSANSNYAYLILNEVLATAIGNGYVYEKLAGATDQNDWYYHKYIDLLARKIYPLVKAYVSGNKAIDKAFIDQYIKLYEDNFPGWINEAENIMTYRYVISENRNDFNTISQLFRYSSNSEYGMELTAQSIESMQQTPLTKVIIISRDNAQKLALIKGQFKALKTWSYNAKEEFVYKTLLADKSQLIIVNQYQSPTATLLKKIK
ncbi:MAG: hypothetical protein EOP54_11385 [Sphingobacteriales bacterium]|nr:MAG: hypothetical protein EOP54_11385 [Sphingobacteriales bacterium]